LPRKAVLPIPVVKPSLTSKIQLVDEEIPVRTDPTKAQGVSEAASRPSQPPKEMLKPKTEFEIVDEGRAFVFTILLPEEVRSMQRWDPNRNYQD
jgi:hypothetical protein